MKGFVPVFLLGASLSLQVHACIWDADTLADEKRKNPNMAQIILGGTNAPVDLQVWRDRIQELQARPKKDDAAWWNDLAGAHLRLGKAKEAAELLEGVRSRFPDDYGIHANLGTAYHLLGRYADAEKEIARDLEINTNAHFGLEKYHLALLQYLVRDSTYRSRHVFVDEYSMSFLCAQAPFMGLQQLNFPELKGKARTARMAELESEYNLTPKDDDYQIGLVLAEWSSLDGALAYRKKWDLAADPKLLDGVLYMTSLNPKQPACFVMLGVLNWQHGDLNLAVAAFEKAISLHSPQTTLLKRKVVGLRKHIYEAQHH